MTILKDAPLGLTQHKEMLNILVSLDETGGCDRRTLRIVAQAVGIREYFDREVNWLQATGACVRASLDPARSGIGEGVSGITVSKPGQLLLTEAQQ